MKLRSYFTGVPVTLAAAILVTAGSVRAHAAPPRGVSELRMAPRALPASGLNAAEKAETAGAASPDKKTLAFHTRSVRLVVHTGPDNDMLSYRIANLRNPTLVVPRGAVLSILFVNTDDDMLHDLRFTTQRAPFPSQPDKRESVGTPEVRHHTKTTFYAERLTVRVQPGTYTYLCTVKGHAKGGMYGTLIVR